MIFDCESATAIIQLYIPFGELSAVCFLTVIQKLVKVKLIGTCDFDIKFNINRKQIYFLIPKYTKQVWQIILKHVDTIQNVNVALYYVEKCGHSHNYLFSNICPLTDFPLLFKDMYK